MKTKTTLISLSLAGLVGCEFYEQLFNWLDNATLVCNDIQSAADTCWASADDEEAESECENLDWQAANCTWELNGEATADEEEEEAEEEPCADLQSYAEACWDWAETEEDEARCEQLDLDLAACLEGDAGGDTAEDDPEEGEDEE